MSIDGLFYLSLPGLPWAPSGSCLALRSLSAWSTPRRVAAAAPWFRSRRRPSGEARGDRLERRQLPDGELVEKPHDGCSLEGSCAYMPSQVLVSYPASRDKQHALVRSDCRQHPADCAACVPCGVRWRGQRCEDSGSVDCTPASGAVLARDRLGNLRGVIGRRRRPVPCGVVAEFGLWAKRYRFTVASSSSHRSGPSRRSPCVPFRVRSAASVPSCSSASDHA